MNWLKDKVKEVLSVMAGLLLWAAWEIFQRLS